MGLAAKTWEDEVMHRGRKEERARIVGECGPGGMQHLGLGDVKIIWILYCAPDLSLKPCHASMMHSGSMRAFPRCCFPFRQLTSCAARMCTCDCAYTHRHVRFHACAAELRDVCDRSAARRCLVGNVFSYTFHHDAFVG